jgi:hypothetical protein
MTKTPSQLDREIEDRDLAEFARGAKKYSPLQRARLAGAVESILRDRGVATFRADDDELAALARAELMHGATPSPVQPKKPLRGRELTGELARSMPRFEFIAHWLAVVTKKKENRGPLGLYVKRVGKRWQIMSPIGGGTVTYETPDPALLFDYARRGQLGPDIRDAEEFRGEAFAKAAP